MLKGWDRTHAIHDTRSLASPTEPLCFSIIGIQTKQNMVFKKVLKQERRRNPNFDRLL